MNGHINTRLFKFDSGSENTSFQQYIDRVPISNRIDPGSITVGGVCSNNLLIFGHCGGGRALLKVMLRYGSCMLV